MSTNKDKNSYKDIKVFESQVNDIPFEEMVHGRKRCNTNKYDTCHSSRDRLDTIRDASSVIRKLNKIGYLPLSSTYLQIYN